MTDLAVRIVDSSSEADLHVKLVDANGDLIMSVGQLSGGCAPGEDCLPTNYIDPADCPVTTHDYMPYALDANANDPDTVILATAPFGYWKCDDASGNPQDSSGNGNHATGISGGADYAQSPILATVGDSIGLVAGERITFPSPENLGDINSTMAMAALISLDGSGNDGSGNSPWRVFMGSDAGSAFQLSYFDNNSGSTWPIDGALTCIEGVNQPGYTSLPLIDTAYPANGNIHFFVLNKKFGAMEAWVDGVLLTCFHASTALGGTPNLSVGCDDDGFWGSADLRVSNVAAWSAPLTNAQIKSMTEAILDAATLAAGFVP